MLPGSSRDEGSIDEEGLEGFSSEDEESGDQAGRSSNRRRRRNILPRVMRGQRCGRCRTCLNPQVIN